MPNSLYPPASRALSDTRKRLAELGENGSIIPRSKGKGR